MRLSVVEYIMRTVSSLTLIKDFITKAYQQRTTPQER